MQHLSSPKVLPECGFYCYTWNENRDDYSFHFFNFVSLFEAKRFLEFVIDDRQHSRSDDGSVLIDNGRIEVWEEREGDLARAFSHEMTDEEREWKFTPTVLTNWRCVGLSAEEKKAVWQKERDDYRSSKKGS